MSRSIRHILQEMSLRQEIILLFLPVVLFPFLLIAIFTSSIISNNAINQATINSEDKLALVSRQLDVVLNEIEYNVRLLSINQALHNVIKNKTSKGTLGDVYFLSDISTVLLSPIYLQSFVNKVEIILNGGKVCSIDLANAKISLDNVNTQKKDTDILVDNALKEKGKIIWNEVLEPDSDKDSKDSKKVSMFLSKAIIDIDGNYLGVMKVYINMDIFSNAYQGIKYGNTGDYLIIDKEGYILSSFQKDKVGTNIYSEEYYKDLKNSDLTDKKFISGSNKVLVTSTLLNKMECYLVGMVPVNELTSDSRRIISLIILVGIAGAFITIAMSIKISRNITKPIFRLVETTKVISEGNLNAETKIGGSGEIRELGKHFNLMVIKIRELMAKVIFEQKQKKEYELSMLQSQMNPHFLYNSIDIIYSLLMKEDLNKARNMVGNLGKFYRSVLSQGRDLILLKEEIELTESYMKINKIKREGFFEYDIDIDTRINSCIIPKLTIQPLVENSIKHGFKGRHGENLIRITGYLEDNKVKIQVSDNGNGLSHKDISNYSKPCPAQSVKSGIGLKNIDERIKLAFGDEYGINLIPTNTETKILILLPYLLKEGAC